MRKYCSQKGHQAEYNVGVLPQFEVTLTDEVARVDQDGGNSNKFSKNIEIDSHEPRFYSPFFVRMLISVSVYSQCFNFCF